MESVRRARRRAVIAARKRATKERLALPVRPPEEPVARPWARSARVVRLPVVLSGATERWSPVVSGDAADLEGSLDAVARFVDGLGELLGGGRVLR